MQISNYICLADTTVIHSNPCVYDLNVADAIDCNLSGLCDGHFLGSEVTSDVSDCIYFCRETQVN